MGSFVQKRVPGESSPAVMGGPGPHLTPDPSLGIDPNLVGNQGYLEFLRENQEEPKTGTAKLPKATEPPGSVVTTSPPSPMWKDRKPVPGRPEQGPTVEPAQRPPQQDSAGFTGKTVDPSEVKKKVKEKM